jgi:signal transduction histidine kinase/ligand-binding sensor domain-containing protein
MLLFTSPLLFSMTKELRFRLVIYWVLLATALAGSALAEHLPVKIYTSADGLGSSFVDYLARDSRGFMWFCTRDGLSRFDGSQFTTYRLSGENAGPGFENISETSRGLYFVSTTGGLFYFDRNTLSETRSDNNGRPVLNAKYAGGNRGYVLEDHAGNLWFGSVGLFRMTVDDNGVKYDPVDLHLPEKIANSIGFTDIFEASDNSLWLTSNLGIIRRLPDGRVVFYDAENSVNQNSISVILDRSGRVWMTKVRRFQIFIPEPISDLGPELFTLKPLNPPAPPRVIKLTPDSDISLPENVGEIFQYSDGDDALLHSAASKLFQSSDGTMWLTSDRGLYQFEGNRVHFSSSEQGLPPSLVRVAEDPAGNLWFGGQSGVMRLDRKGLISYGSADGLNSSAISAINEDRDGKLYFANGIFYISEFDGKRFETVRPAISADARIAWTSRFSFIDSTGGWWILSQLGLYRYSPVSNIKLLDNAKPSATYGMETGFRSNGMFQIFEDSKGTVWVSTQSSMPRTRELASKKRGEEVFHTYSEDDGYPTFRSPSSFAEGSDGSVWFGFYEGGLARYRDGKFTVILPETGTPNGLVSDLLFDSNGRLWFSSALDGLYISDNPQDEHPIFRKVVPTDNLQSQNIRTLVDDKEGNIYAGTVRGIDRISPDLQHVKHYSVNDGLASDFVVDSHRDRNGTLWFATTNGLSKLVPANDEMVMPPPILIGGLRIAGVEQNVPALGETQIQTDELVHTQNNFEIDYYGLDFRAGERLRYQYLLEGADSDWSRPSDLRTVTYANLQPGSYRFLVRAVNSDGTASVNPASVTFKILPPIWARWWFLALAAIAIGLLVVGFYRYRFNRLREVNEALLTARNAEANLRRAREERLAELESVRTRIATDLHDDIGASLTQIAVLSEVARTQANSGNGNTAPLVKISAVTNELVETMSDIVWSINPAKDHLSDLTQRMRRFASDILSSRDIGIQFRIPDESNKIKIKAGVRREVFLIFKESINNIAKHSKASHVEIDLEVSVVELNLNIGDDGCGFLIGETVEGDGGNGLMSMKKRAEAINGSLRIISAPDSGTRLSLTLPLEQTVSP